MTAHFEDEQGRIVVFACEELSTDDSSERFQIVHETPGLRILDMAIVFRYDPTTTPFQDIDVARMLWTRNLNLCFATKCIFTRSATR